MKVDNIDIEEDDSNRTTVYLESKNTYRTWVHLMAIDHDVDKADVHEATVQVAMGHEAEVADRLRGDEL